MRLVCIAANIFKTERNVFEALCADHKEFFVGATSEFRGPTRIFVDVSSSDSEWGIKALGT